MRGGEKLLTGKLFGLLLDPTTLKVKLFGDSEGGRKLLQIRSFGAVAMIGP